MGNFIKMNPFLAEFDEIKHTCASITSEECSSSSIVKSCHKLEVEVEITPAQQQFNNMLLTKTIKSDLSNGKLTIERVNITAWYPRKKYGFVWCETIGKHAFFHQYDFRKFVWMIPALRKTGVSFQALVLQKSDGLKLPIIDNDFFVNLTQVLEQHGISKAGLSRRM